MINPYQNSFLSLAQNKKKLKCEKFLDEMNKAIPWKELINEIKPYYKKSKVGRNKTDLELLLRIYFLQQWYNLSDPGVEEAIYDRNSFQKFLGIDLLSSNIPDETTILNFRHLLEKNKIQEKFFSLVTQILTEKEMILKKGTIVDATIITAPSSTKNKDKKRDEEMKSTKKGDTWHFGMKTHIGVDESSGLVHSIQNTSANIADITVMNELFHGKEKAKFGDKAYAKKEDKREARKKGIFYGILDKAVKGKKLSNKQEKRNSKLSSIRAKVEHPFRVLKCQWGYRKVKYKGLEKNSLNLYTLFSLINIYMARKSLIQQV
jgi:transposase, IS5 family